MQLETDEKKLRKEITFTIKNQLGVRVGLFTPDMAFESIVKDQIRKLMSPSLKCVDLVSTELGAVVQKCSEGVGEVFRSMSIAQQSVLLISFKKQTKKKRGGIKKREGMATAAVEGGNQMCREFETEGKYYICTVTHLPLPSDGEVPFVER